MSAITTHVLDTSRGCPAAGVFVVLECRTDISWLKLGDGATDVDGRCRNLLGPTTPLAAGTYRLTFQTGDYFRAHGATAFYPEVQVTFEVRDSAQHYHVPLLLGPFGYTTYRGS